jgi:hypothetical protein
MIRAVVGVLLAILAVLAGASGCGVSSEEEPQPLLERLVEQQPRVDPTMRSSTSPVHTATTATSPPPVTDVRTAPVLTSDGPAR